MGSGENAAWNRYIDCNPPQHSLTARKPASSWAWKWRFVGVGGVGGLPAHPGKDATTGAPLTGHLVGRHVWQAVPAEGQGSEPDTEYAPATNANSADKLFRAQRLAANGMDPADVTAPERGTAEVSVDDAIADAVRFYAGLQCDDGHWGGDYGGPFFLMPGLVIACHVTGTPLSDAHREAMSAYLLNHQQLDGGWGLHIEGPPTMFGTAMNYVALRCLGMRADEKPAVAARAWIIEHGGATGIPSWGKFWLCVLGVYEWEGLNSIPPELWMLPEWFPFHPWRMWCHARMVYLPMSYLYGARVRAAPGKLQAELKAELYATPYQAIDWNAARNCVCEVDLYSPHSKLMDMLNEVLAVYEKMPLAALRKAGVKFAGQYCAQEDLQTNYVDIGPVNKVMNMIVAWHRDGADAETFLMHQPRLLDYLWVAEDGMKMQGYNGSQLWDTAFFVQAAEATGMMHQWPALFAKTHEFLDATQIKQDEVDADKWYRIVSKGGWPFSTNDHGWPIADCTAEGLKAALAIRAAGLTATPIPPARLYSAVDLILHYQNSDGGWATYERNRGWDWFELLNPAEVFGDIMIDYTYTELSSACITGLAAFVRQFPGYRTADIAKAMRRGVEFVAAQQRADGSFYGSWAVCFTYGCWFGVEALRAGGMQHGAPALQKVCKFLLSKQQADGGWGESYLSCVRKEYVARESTVFQTAWAIMALCHAGCDDVDAVERGVRFLLRRQRVTGDWAQESVAGIFNRTCGITYTAYRNVFPIWALGVYRTAYPQRTVPTDAPLE